VIDPTGEMADYYDKDGRWLFTDNIKDNLVYIATATTFSWQGCAPRDPLVESYRWFVPAFCFPYYSF